MAIVRAAAPVRSPVCVVIAFVTLAVLAVIALLIEFASLSVVTASSAISAVVIWSSAILAVVTASSARSTVIFNFADVFAVLIKTYPALVIRIFSVVLSSGVPTVTALAAYLTTSTLVEFAGAVENVRVVPLILYVAFS